MTLAPSRLLGPRLVVLHSEWVHHELDQWLCANPTCNRRCSENHHIEPRSRAGAAVDFVSIDGMVRPNRCMLCTECHRDVTGGIGGYKARIVWDDQLGFWAWQRKDNGLWITTSTLRGIAGTGNPPVLDADDLFREKHLTPKQARRGRGSRLQSRPVPKGRSIGS